MSISSVFESRGITSVAGRTYPGTYAIARKSSFLAEQVSNRDSATWKKAEHIVLLELQEDEGRSVLGGWRMLTAAEPIGLSSQKLYVAVGDNQFVKYDAEGHCLGRGGLEKLV